MIPSFYVYLLYQQQASGRETKESPPFVRDSGLKLTGGKTLFMAFCSKLVPSKTGTRLLYLLSGTTNMLQRSVLFVDAPSRSTSAITYPR
jgi:hypothetical protein